MTAAPTAWRATRFTPALAAPAAEIEVRNPADVRQVVGSYPMVGTGYVDSVVARAERVRPAWAALPAVERFARLTAAIDALDLTGRDELLVREQGKVLAEATLEIGYAARVLAGLHADASWLDDAVRTPGTGAARSTVHHEPVGTVAVVTPWNWPYSLAVISVLPALLAGNAVVLLVAPTAPLAALDVFGQLAAQLPEGLLSVFTAPGSEVAQHLVEHPSVRMVSFTGSVETGRTIMAEAARTLTKLTLELGGNDAAILLDDVVVDDALLGRLAAGAFTTSGQVCMAIKRLYVPERLLADVVDGLGDVLDGWVVGDGLDPATTMGPLHSAGQRRRVSALLAGAVEAGGTPRPHGRLTGDPAVGHFLLPTLVTGADPRCPLVVEEQFGPVLPVLTYRGVDEAVAAANGTEFGLCSSVWSADEERAVAVARRLEAGTTFINAHGTAAVDGSAPYGGVKHSGCGRRGGRWGVESFTEQHSIVRLAGSA